MSRLTQPAVAVAVASCPRVPRAQIPADQQVKTPEAVTSINDARPKVAPFRKLGLLGKGSFGTVYLVETISDGERLAVKEIPCARMERDEKSKALRELQILRKLVHPHIVKYKGAFTNAGSLIICMEYADGGDMHQRIKERRGIHFGEQQIVSWLFQLGEALSYLHGRRILHRDLKTQNIFLTKSDVVKLGDFGISRVLSNTHDHARTLVGTPYYLSPEICESKPYDFKSDMWALGCVLYEMVTLKHAFDAQSIRALVLKILTGRYPPIPSFYTPQLALVVDKLLHLHPEYRPTAQALLTETLFEHEVYVAARPLENVSRSETAACSSLGAASGHGEERQPPRTTLATDHPQPEPFVPIGHESKKTRCAPDTLHTHAHQPQPQHEVNHPARMAESNSAKCPSSHPQVQNWADEDSGWSSPNSSGQASSSSSCSSTGGASSSSYSSSSTSLSAETVRKLPVVPAVEALDLEVAEMMAGIWSEADQPDGQHGSSRFLRIEALRAFVENKLGLALFRQIYGFMSDVTKDISEQHIAATIMTLLGQQSSLYNVILQLVACEQRMYSANVWRK
ncbi:Nek4 protein [Capsaspora owczarzaki ATCC 30864]|uniref:non-specific serine/threonine protein kinase n=1 Tax=Capsaspora owczarzaki (strain ATCC 30864) TaxID=595528 RepID=A0A0D2X0L1_CAPO3|nr:Nek4 protein [Capsaspora owczarzaki ATCC 30864]KJE89249.1 NEK protein kinase [Capsaspora owczarzaki ATCC 30864]|eukprot:XP_004365630.1 Nek4 protein [Capsaspora owczarzaki ATCC 30864]